MWISEAPLCRIDNGFLKFIEIKKQFSNGHVPTIDSKLLSLAQIISYKTRG